VAATLARAGLATEEDVVRFAVVEARGQLSDALSQLRDLARGIYPAVLSQGGLPAALPTLAETAPMAIDVDVPANLRRLRLGQAVESTAWFVAVESVSNAVKHARCSVVRISLRLDSSAHNNLKQLVLRVTDDGCGGAALVSDGGLAGLVDRAAAIGGSLTVVSKTGLGTTVEAVLPCAS
jgi:signal transduction histidine kinase